MLILDGPVAGTYMTRRAPIWLRAVVGPRGRKDVLDQLDDTPAPGEKVHVYRQTHYRGPVHINMGHRSGTGFYDSGQYQHCPDVDGDTLRDMEAWRTWVQERIRDDHPGAQVDMETGALVEPTP